MSNFDLEAIKKVMEERELGKTYDSPGGFPPLDDLTDEQKYQLIQEIERLRGMEEAFFKSAKTIESLTKERDEMEKDRDYWKESHEMLDIRTADPKYKEEKAFIHRVASELKEHGRVQEERIEKLEAENAELKETYDILSVGGFSEFKALTQKLADAEKRFMTCDYVGCDELVTGGTPQKNGLYHSTCRKHHHLAEEGQ